MGALNGQQTAVVLKLNAELKVSFPGFLNVFSKVTTKSSLNLLSAYPLAKDILAAAKDASIFGRALPSNAVRIRLYIETYQTYQKHLDALMLSLRGIGFLSATVLIAEMGSFDLFSSPKKLYAYFGLDPAVKQSGNFKGDKVHMSKRGSSLARRVLHMVALNNLKVNKGTGLPVNPVIHDYYIRKCASKKKNVAVGAVMHKICNIIFAMLRDNKPFEIITPEAHCTQYALDHPINAGKVA